MREMKKVVYQAPNIKVKAMAVEHDILAASNQPDGNASTSDPEGFAKPSSSSIWESDDADK